MLSYTKFWSLGAQTDPSNKALHDNQALPAPEMQWGLCSQSSSSFRWHRGTSVHALRTCASLFLCAGLSEQNPAELCIFGSKMKTLKLEK